MPFNFAPQENFGSALASGLSDQINQRTQSKLKLQMESQKIGMQQAADSALSAQQAQQGLQSQKFGQQLNTMPPDQFSTIMKQAAAQHAAMLRGEPPPEFDFSTISHPMAQQAAVKLAENANSTGGAVRMDKIDNGDGTFSFSKFNTKTGTYLGTTPPMGTTNDQAKMQNVARQEYLGTNSLADELQKASDHFSATTAGKALLGKPNAALNTITQTDPDLQAYQSTVNSIAAELGKKNTGRFNMAEVPLYAQTLPSVSNTMATNNALIQAMRQGAYRKISSAYGGDDKHLQSMGYTPIGLSRGAAQTPNTDPAKQQQSMLQNAREQEVQAYFKRNGLDQNGDPIAKPKAQGK